MLMTSDSRPEPVSAATRPAISLPVAEADTRTGTWRSAARPTRTSTSGVIRYLPASSDSAARISPAPYLLRVSAKLSAVPGLPTTTAAGVPKARAAVSSSAVVFFRSPSVWSTSTRTSVMVNSSPAVSSFGVRDGRLDALVRLEELGQPHAGVALVGDALACGLLRLRGGGGHVGGGVLQADLLGLGGHVGEGELADRLLLRGHDALEGGE